MENHDHHGVTMVTLATLGLAFKGIFLKLTYMTGLSVEAGVVWRFVIALPLFWGFALWRTQGQSWSIAPKDRVTVFICGLCFAVATYADALAVDRLGVAVSRLVLFVFPVFILIFEAIRQKRWPGKRSCVAALLAYFGLALVLLGGETALHEIDLLGIFAGLMSAMSYALFLVLGSSLVKQIGSPRFTAMVQSLTLIAVASPALFWGDGGQTVPETAWIWLIAAAILSTFLPLLLLYEGMKHVGSEITGLLSYIGPGVTVLAAWLILGEKMGPIQFLGIGFLCIGLMIAQAMENWVLHGFKKVFQNRP